MLHYCSFIVINASISTGFNWLCLTVFFLYSCSFDLSFKVLQILFIAIWFPDWDVIFFNLFLWFFFILSLACFFKVIFHLTVIILMNNFNNWILIGSLRLDILMTIFSTLLRYFWCDFIKFLKSFFIRIMPPLGNRFVIFHRFL